MNKDKQMVNDLIEIFDEEHGKRYLITPHNTAQKLTAKGYRKASEVAAEIFAEIDKELAHYENVLEKQMMFYHAGTVSFTRKEILNELKKKYTEDGR